MLFFIPLLPMTSSLPFPSFACCAIFPKCGGWPTMIAFRRASLTSSSSSSSSSSARRLCVKRRLFFVSQLRIFPLFFRLVGARQTIIWLVGTWHVIDLVLLGIIPPCPFLPSLISIPQVYGRGGTLFFSPFVHFRFFPPFASFPPPIPPFPCDAIGSWHLSNLSGPISPQVCQNPLCARGGGWHKCPPFLPFRSNSFLKR